MTSDRFLDDLVAKVNAQAPDIILVGGDILEGDRRDEDTGRYVRAFRGMTSKYGIFAVPGNHEGFARTRSGDFLNKAGIRLLQDEIVPVDQAINLVGRRDQRSRTRTPLAPLSRPPPATCPSSCSSIGPRTSTRLRGTASRSCSPAIRTTASSFRRTSSRAASTRSATDTP